MGCSAWFTAKSQAQIISRSAMTTLLRGQVVRRENLELLHRWPQSPSMYLAVCVAAVSKRRRATQRNPAVDRCSQIRNGIAGRLRQIGIGAARKKTSGFAKMAKIPPPI